MVKQKRRKYEQKDIIKKFDAFVESRISIVSNWVWKSGMILTLIVLVFQNLDLQRENLMQIRQNTIHITSLSEANEKLIKIISKNEEMINEIKGNVGINKINIEYLKQDVNELRNIDG